VVPVQPQAVQLLRFTATANDNGAAIEWATGAEVNSFGFVLYRAASNNRAAAMLVTQEVIPAQGRSATYRFEDATTQAGQPYFYWLVEIERDGDQMEYGPTQLGAAHAAHVLEVVAGGVAMPVAGVPVPPPVQTSAEVLMQAGGNQAPQSRVEVLAQGVSSWSKPPVSQPEVAKVKVDVASSSAAQPAQPARVVADEPEPVGTVAAPQAKPVENHIPTESAPALDKAPVQQVAVRVSPLSVAVGNTPERNGWPLVAWLMAGIGLAAVVVLGGLGLLRRRR
jgi:hypothetical protein